MGLFDIFKKKKSESSFPENELEKTLLEAATKPSAQRAFYQKLLWNDIYAITNPDDGTEDGVTTAEEDTTVQLLTLETGQIPVFTSQNRMFDKGVIKEEVRFIAMKGQDLFALAKGATFVLNPFSDYGKELLPNELESLLDGTIFDSENGSNLGDEEAILLNEIFERAKKRQEDLIFLEGYRNKNLKPSERKQLETSIAEFQQCLDISPNHWQSLFLMAKSHQRLGKHAQSLELLEKAFAIETANHFIPLEAALEAMHMEDLEKALFYSEDALKRKPNDPALMGNYAMNLLIANRDDDAKTTIDRAMEIAPKDAVNQNIRSTINAVISGKRKRPTFEDTLQ